MTGKAPSKEFEAHQSRQRDFVAVLTATVLALGVAAGVGAWQITRDDEPARTTTQAQLPATAEPVAVAEPAPPPAARVQPQPTYYLVSSQEQADRLRAALDEADQIVAAMGQPPTEVNNARFEVLTTPEDEARFWQLMRDEHEWLRELGGSGSRVVDLRIPPEAAPERDTSEIVE